MNWDTDYNNAVLLNAILGNRWNIEIRNAGLVPLETAGYNRTFTVTDTNTAYACYVKPNYQEDPQTDDYPQTFRGVDWGDGTQEYIAYEDGGWAREKTFVHFYSAVGTYTVRAICLDGNPADLTAWNCYEYQNFDVQCTIAGELNVFKITGISPYSVLINWGDGSPWETVNMNFQYTVSKSHGYTSAGVYTVRIRTAGFKNLQFTPFSSDSTSTLSAILSDRIPSVNNACYFRVKSSYLTAVPSTLFANCHNNTTFSECFKECTALTAIPAGLFDGCNAVQSFYSAFHYCRALGGLAPTVWLSHPNAEGTNCFATCTGLSNYSDIPASWK